MAQRQDGENAHRSAARETAFDKRQPVLAPEDIIADDVGRCAEYAAFEGGFGVGNAPFRPTGFGAEFENRIGIETARLIAAGTADAAVGVVDFDHLSVGIADDLRWGLIGALLSAKSRRNTLEFYKFASWRFLRCSMAVREPRFGEALRRVA